MSDSEDLLLDRMAQFLGACKWDAVRLNRNADPPIVWDSQGAWPVRRWAEDRVRQIEERGERSDDD